MSFVNTLRDNFKKELLKGTQKLINKKYIENGETPPPAITGQRKIIEKGELILIELEEAPTGQFCDENIPPGIMIIIMI